MPVALTEVHLACTREEQLRWLLEAWTARSAARAAGRRRRAVTPWALLGSYDWDSLVTEARGHYEPGAFDVRAAAPRPTALARAHRAAGARRTSRRIPASSAPAGGGGRSGCSNPPARRMRQRRRASRRPLLILGATGTLGRAFQRDGRQRAACPRSAPAGADVDITDADSVHAAGRGGCSRGR